MRPLPEFFQLDRYHISPADVTQMIFHCQPESIRPGVILMPWWRPGIFAPWVDETREISANILYEVNYQGHAFSVIRSGIGAPQSGDAMLALGCTACERVLFAGSIGALRADIRIGDLMLPDYSICGDGFCRYLEPGFPPGDCFLEREEPDAGLTGALARAVEPLAREAGVGVCAGPVYSTDSILAQFGKLDEIIRLGCIGIEMETAAVFKAARRVGIRAAALFSVSDVPVLNKSLYSGRSQAEQDYRIETRGKVLARALLECLYAASRS